MSSDNKDESRENRLLYLLLKLPANIIALLKLELENLKLELSKRSRNLFIALGFFAVALFLLFFFVAMILVLIIAVLNLFLPFWLTSIIIIVLIILGILGLLKLGIMYVSRASFLPNDTLSSMQEDFEFISKVARGEDEDEI